VFVFRAFTSDSIYITAYKKNHNIKIRNKTFGRVEHFRYLGTTVTNQNSIH
jgi:hypothetical protein